MLPEFVHVLIDFAVSIAAGMVAAIAFFQWLGKRWIENRFSKNLEQFKHQQAQEIERLRYRISALMDRTSKLHQHEFEVLPEIWDKLSIAIADNLNLTSRMKSYPDIDAMGSKQFAEFIEKCELHDWEREELKQSHSRNSKYAELIFWHRLHKVRRSHADFHNTLISKGIFVQPELKEKIRSLSNMMYDSFQEEQFDKEVPQLGPERFKKRDLLRQECQSRLDDIEHCVQSRLWEANKLD